MKVKYEAQDKKVRLDNFLNEKLDLSRSKIQRLIKSGEITVDSNTVPVHHFLQVGEVVEYKATQVKELAKVKKFKPNPKVKFKVVKEMDNYVIIDKRSGLLVHPTDRMEDDTLAGGLLAKYPEIKKVGEDELRPGIVHRIDKKVSGLMLVARNEKAFKYFKKKFQDRGISKTYIALVHGQMAEEVGEIDLRISRSKNKSGKMAALPANSEDGRDALTKYEVIETFDHLSLLKVQIITGRTHQIRVHLNALNNPIVGDDLYKQKNNKQNLDVGRPFLHSAELEFAEMNGDIVKYTSKLPKALEDALAKLRK